MSRDKITSNPSGRSLLVIVLDMTPAWWGLCETEDFSLPKCIEAAIGLANLHLMLTPLNEVALLGVTPSGTHFLHPLDRFEDQIESSHEGQYDLLGCMNDSVRRRALDIVESCSSDATNVVLAGAVLKALCYFLRRCRELAPTKRYDELSPDQFDLSEPGEFTDRIAARILVIKAADDNPSQYLALMNGIFTAQKLHIPIDTCVLPLIPQVDNSTLKLLDRNCSKFAGHSSLFQQAADLTGGIYIQVPRVAGLLQYLISVFLPSQNLRHRLLLPDSRSSGFGGGVDFRAACFCHRRLIDIGYVCSVCLSVFCEFNPLCTTCGTPFALPPVQLQ